MMRHYLFSEEVTGEEFIVGADSEDEAHEAAFEIGVDLVEMWEPGEVPELICYGEISDEEAEASGLDEY